MSQTHEFRAQTGVNVPPISGIFTYYVNQSGILRFNTTGGQDRCASTFYPETGLKATGGLSNVSTGAATLTAGISAIVYGSSGNAFAAGPTVLGEPTLWVKAFGPNGELLAIPAYTRLN